MTAGAEDPADAFADDPERLARFTREAQMLAALNHPHIAHGAAIPVKGSRPVTGSEQGVIWPKGVQE